MTFGSYEAKTHFPALLDRVAEGEEVVITRHGVPVAKLIPYSQAHPKRDVAEIIERIREFRKRNRLDGLTIRELREEGRR